MIINRLSILLAERNIRANRLAIETGIAQSTLTRITNNRSSQIDYDTLNKICNFFKITPNDFFDYTPLDFEVNCSLEEKELTIFITVSRYNIREDIIELTPKISRIKKAKKDSSDDDSSKEKIVVQFSPSQTSLYSIIYKKTTNVIDGAISTAIAQRVYDNVLEGLQGVVSNIYEQEFLDFISDYASLADSQNDVSREAKKKEKEIINRLETNLSPF